MAHPKGALVFQHACKLGAEGIVSKRLGSGTEAGRAELEEHLKALVEASISVQAKQSPPLPLFPP
jgi:hypothetical protein